jgi:metal-responsive CopG/Arc/MetJ family transcriptional regulator
MATIQIVVDDPLLKETDRVAKRQKMNRSALIRTALQAHLHRLHIRDLEEQERRAYQAFPDNPAWPED